MSRLADYQAALDLTRMRGDMAPAPGDTNVTAEFKAMSRAFEWLDDLRFSVAQLVVRIAPRHKPASFQSVGSAVLIDHSGTLILTGTQLDVAAERWASADPIAPMELSVVFCLGNQSQGYGVSEIWRSPRETSLWDAPPPDIAFVTMTPHGLEQSQRQLIRPIRFGARNIRGLTHQANNAFDERSVVLAGIPNDPRYVARDGLAHLHATICDIQRQYVMDIGGNAPICGWGLAGDIVDGMQGGGVFIDNKMIATCSRTVGMNPGAVSSEWGIVPIEYSIAVYQQMLEARAATTPIPAPAMPVPRECRMWPQPT